MIGVYVLTIAVLLLGGAMCYVACLIRREEREFLEKYIERRDRD